MHYAPCAACAVAPVECLHAQWQAVLEGGCLELSGVYAGLSCMDAVWDDVQQLPASGVGDEQRNYQIGQLKWHCMGHEDV